MKEDIFLKLEQPELAKIQTLMFRAIHFEEFTQRGQWRAFGQQLSKCVNLETFYVFDNFGFTQEHWQIIGEALSNCTNLKNLSNDCYHFDYFGDALSKCPNLKSLNFSSIRLNDFTPEQWQAFGEALSKCPNLQNLYVTGIRLNDFTPEQWLAFGEALSKCPNWQNLDLPDNYLGRLTTEQWHAFGEALSKCPNLEILELSNNDLGRLTTKQWQAFGEALSKCPNLEILELSNNDLGRLTTKQWQAFGEALSKCPNLKILELPDNYLGRLTSAQWQAFCDSLSKCPNLEILDLSGNDLGELTTEGWQAFGEALSKCPHLKSLLLPRNKLVKLAEPIDEDEESVDEDEEPVKKYNECREFLRALAKCANLQSLDLSENQLDRLDIEVEQILKEGINNLHLYHDFDNYQFTKYTENYHKQALRKSQGFFQKIRSANKKVIHNNAIEQVVKFLDANDVCNLQRVCKSDVGLNLLDTFVKQYFKELFARLDYETLYYITQDFALDNDDEIYKNAYNIKEPNIDMFLQQFDSVVNVADLKRWLKLEGKNTHLSKFYYSHQLNNTLAEIMTLKHENHLLFEELKEEYGDSESENKSEYKRLRMRYH